jgi:uncharacterized membrane protein
MAEKNLDHAHKMQELALNGEIEDHKSGRLYGFLALALLIIGAIIAAYIGNTTVAVAFLGAGALGTVGVIIKGARSA